MGNRISQIHLRFLASSFTTHVEAWDDGWETTKRQDRVTAHLNTVIATPIFHAQQNESEGDEDPVAVLILDSSAGLDEILGVEAREKLQQVDFKETKIASRAVEHARNIGIIL